MPSDCQPTDVVLLRLHGPQPDVAAIARRLDSLSAISHIGAVLGRCAWSADAGVAHLHLRLPGRIALSHREAAALGGAAEPTAQVQVQVQVQVARLTLMHDIAGRSSGEPAPFHYAVEMTPEAGFGVELQRWYDTEHLPGLAGVPGCVRAQRYWNCDEGPQSLACYDLVSPETLGSQAWLEVRHTAWSARMRPRFTQTRRTMFTVLR